MSQPAGTARSLLSMLTLTNFEKISADIAMLEITEPGQLQELVGLIFDKTLEEPHFAKMYTQLCSAIMGKLPAFDGEVPGRMMTFTRCLLNKCQGEMELPGSRNHEVTDVVCEAFAMGQHERLGEKSIVSVVEPGVVRIILDAVCLVSERKRMLGNIKFICELFAERILNEKILHECVKRLLLSEDEDTIECLCTLMVTAGKLLDRPAAKHYMDYYFKMMGETAEKVGKKPGFNRLAVMLRETIDIRQNLWAGVALPQVRETVAALVESAAPDEEILAWLSLFEAYPRKDRSHTASFDRNNSRCILGVVVRHACKEAGGALALAAAHPGEALRAKTGVAFTQMPGFSASPTALKLRALLEKRTVLLTTCLSRRRHSRADQAFALLEVQLVSQEMQHPPDLLANLFAVLYDLEVVNAGACRYWKHSSSPEHYEEHGRPLPARKGDARDAFSPDENIHARKEVTFRALQIE